MVDVSILIYMVYNQLVTGGHHLVDVQIPCKPETPQTLAISSGKHRTMLARDVGA